MMAKIFGAALIVSGGYLGGWIPSKNVRMRLALIKEIHGIFLDFQRSLKQHRVALEAELTKRGKLANELLQQMPIRGMAEEDQAQIYTSIEVIKRSDYRESLAETERLINYLEETERRLAYEEKTKGRALPLTTGAIGLLAAILLI